MQLKRDLIARCSRTNAVSGPGGPDETVKGIQRKSLIIMHETTTLVGTPDTNRSRRRTSTDRAAAERLTRRVRADLDLTRALLPAGGIRLAIDESPEASARRTQDAVLDVVADRILRVLDADAGEELPFSLSAESNAEATEQAAFKMRLVRDDD